MTYKFAGGNNSNPEWRIEIKKYSEMSSVNDQTVMITTKIDKAPFFLKKDFSH